MYRNNFWRFLAKIWPENTTSRDGCVLLMFVLQDYFQDPPMIPLRKTINGHFHGYFYLATLFCHAKQKKTLKHSQEMLCFRGKRQKSVRMGATSPLLVPSSASLVKGYFAAMDSSMPGKGSSMLKMGNFADDCSPSFVVCCTVSEGMSFRIASGSFHWNNRKGGTTEGGTPREPFPNTTQGRIDTYPRCIQTGLDTYRNALSLQPNIEKLRARAPNAQLRLTRVHERIFAVPLLRATPLPDYSNSIGVTH